mmetsp:Transcript_31855/g.101476  ORF Transcript_31855/g.101476 Transcript_31855/m.101476 type:complete len:381 (-) Transcript_31855:327-1469(-)
MLAPHVVRRREGLVDVAHGLLGGSLLDEGAAELEVVGGDHLDGLLQNLGLHGAGLLLQQLAQLVGQAHAQRLLARHHGQGPDEAAHHQVRGAAHSVLVGLHRKVLEDELARGHARDGHAPLHHGGDDLPDGAVHGHGHEALELQPLRHNPKGRVDLDVRLQIEIGQRARLLQTAQGRGDLRGQGAGSARSRLVVEPLGARQAHVEHPGERRLLVGRGRLRGGLRGLRGGGLGVVLDVRVVVVVARVVAEGVGRLDGPLVDIDPEVLEEHLDLELEVELHLLVVEDLHHEAQDRHQPRVGRLEDLGVLARLEHLGHERDHRDHAAPLEGVVDERLDVQLLVQHGLVARDGELPQPAPEVLEEAALARVALDLVALEQGLDV